MTNVEKLEQDIRRLGRQELAELREWFQKYDDEEWDHQIKSDIEKGKLDSLTREALDAYRARNIKEL